MYLPLLGDGHEASVYIWVIAVVSVIFLPIPAGAMETQGTIKSVEIYGSPGEVTGYALCGGERYESTGPVYHFGEGVIAVDYNPPLEKIPIKFNSSGSMAEKRKYGDYIEVLVRGYEEYESDGTLKYAQTETWIFSNDVNVDIVWTDPNTGKPVGWYRVTAPCNMGHEPVE